MTEEDAKNELREIVMEFIRCARDLPEDHVELYRIKEETPELKMVLVTPEFKQKIVRIFMESLD